MFDRRPLHLQCMDAHEGLHVGRTQGKQLSMECSDSKRHTLQAVDSSGDGCGNGGVGGREVKTGLGYKDGTGDCITDTCVGWGATRAGDGRSECNNGGHSRGRQDSDGTSAGALHAVHGGQSAMQRRVGGEGGPLRGADGDGNGVGAGDRCQALAVVKSSLQQKQADDLLEFKTQVLQRLMVNNSYNSVDFGAIPNPHTLDDLECNSRAYVDPALPPPCPTRIPNVGSCRSPQETESLALESAVDGLDPAQDSSVLLYGAMVADLHCMSEELDTRVPPDSPPGPLAIPPALGGELPRDRDTHSSRDPHSHLAVRLNGRHFSGHSTNPSAETKLHHTQSPNHSPGQQQHTQQQMQPGAKGTAGLDH